MFQPESITSAPFGHLLLHKKIKNLGFKRKLTPFIYCLTFGGGSILGFIFGNFLFVVLLGGVGFLFHTTIQEFWKEGKGRLMIGVSPLGIMAYMNLFKNQSRMTPLVSWNQIDRFKMINIDGKSIFIIYLKIEILGNSDVNNVDVDRIKSVLIDNKRKYGAEIVIDADDFQANDYVNFVEEFRTTYELNRS